MIEQIKEKLQQLPTKPGVYLFKNRQGNVLYVGKAKSLKPRVTSYFQQHTELSDAKRLMVQQATALDWMVVKSELDALALEDQLIKDYQPRFNVLAKDDKSFLYIHITAEDFPRVIPMRRPDWKLPGMYYGPYPFARTLRDVMKLLHRVFPFRTCAKLPNKPCLEYYIGACKAPCIGLIDQPAYRLMIDQVIDVFEGKANDIAVEFEQRMQVAAQQQQFEVAGRLRDQVAALHKLRALQKSPRQYLKDYYTSTNLDPQQGIQQLAEALALPKLPHRIETYDISNVQGQYSVGSMIVFTDGLPDKAEYRRFKIKTVRGPNDFASHNEVVRRRLRRDWPLPDLVIVDGGKGQLSSVAGLWQTAGVPVVGLAKRREEIFVVNQSVPVMLPPGSQGLFLVQRMRDEAHRFAITYYRSLHKKAMRPQKK